MRRHALPLVLVCWLPACTQSRGKLEQLVPDGATVVMSLDGQALVASDIYKKTMEAVEKSPEAKANFDKVKDECKIDISKYQAAVVGIDALSKGVMGAIRIPNIGKKESLECLGKVTEDSSWVVGEEDGKPKVDLPDESILWALDDNTVVFSTKGWTGAVKSRIKGEGKPAIDNSLKDAVALADRSMHMWFAGEVPPIVKPFMENTPAKGAERAAGGFNLKGSDMSLKVVAEMDSEESASSLKTEGEKWLGTAKAFVAKQEAVPAEAIDTVKFETNAKQVTVTATIPMGELIDQTTDTFTQYISKSKTAEAKVMVAKMFDASAAYFREEHVERGASITAELPPHRCPNDGKAEGSIGPTPPLSVKCHEGPSKKCTPKAGGTGPGEYDPKVFTDNDVWNGLNFQMDDPHYYHYAFKWKNDPEGFGSCTFTVQAFGDLDGDGVYSTFERSGTANKDGVSGAAGLKTNQETE